MTTKVKSYSLSAKKTWAAEMGFFLVLASTKILQNGIKFSGNGFWNKMSIDAECAAGGEGFAMAPV